MDEQNLEGKHSKQEEESHRSKGDDGELYEVDDGEDEKQRVLKLPDKRIEAESRSTQSGTIAASSSSQLEESDLHSDLDVSSNLLSEVPVEYTLQPLESAEFKDKFVVANPRRHTPTHLQSPKHPTPIELSPTSVTQSVSSAPSPILPENKLSAASNYSSICVEKVYNQGFSPSTDGYNWRKYGQKLVKSPQGSRSYYRCTHSECCAKKIECCDHSNRLIEVIYRSRHSHDPPKKLNHLKQQCRVTNISTSSKEQGQEMAPMPEKEQANSDLFVKKDESLDEPEPKRRVTVKKISSPYSVSVLKSGKKPKFVVHAAGDVGVSGDGYRWRKYGQKMVSGNPNPRNYYRCTSAGCLVRKHVERAVDNTTAVIITYKGIHDHDMPVPKKRHGPPSAPLIAATASLTSTTAAATAPPRAATTTVLTTQWSVDRKGELTREELDIGEEKAMESAKTLLSIGFEIKPC